MGDNQFGFSVEQVTGYYKSWLRGTLGGETLQTPFILPLMIKIWVGEMTRWVRHLKASVGTYVHIHRPHIN